MHGGNIAVLLQLSEFIIIGGAGMGAIIMGNKPSVVKEIFTQSFALVRRNPFDRAAYTELLQVLYDVFYAARPCAASKSSRIRTSVLHRTLINGSATASTSTRRSSNPRCRRSSSITVGSTSATRTGSGSSG
jgi:hypothetical protein